MKVLLLPKERLSFFANVPDYWDFRFEPQLDPGELLEFIHVDKLVARAEPGAIEFIHHAPKEWRVHLREFIDLRDERERQLEDWRTKLMGLGSRLVGIRQEYADKDALIYLLRVASTCQDRASARRFLLANETPVALRKIGHRQILDDLWRAFEVQ